MTKDNREEALPPFARESAEGIVLSVYVAPGAKRTGVAGLHGDRLKLAVRAQPVEGRANEAVMDLVAQLFGLKQSQVEMLQGESSRNKSICLKGLNPSALISALAAVGIVEGGSTLHGVPSSRAPTRR